MLSQLIDPSIFVWKYLRVREDVQRDELTVEWVGTEEQLADGLTKILPGPGTAQMRDKLQLVNCSRDLWGSVVLRCPAVLSCAMHAMF